MTGVYRTNTIRSCLADMKKLVDFFPSAVISWGRLLFPGCARSELTVGDLTPVQQESARELKGYHPTINCHCLSLPL